jgi:hypothetical protein
MLLALCVIGNPLSCEQPVLDDSYAIDAYGVVLSRRVRTMPESSRGCCSACITAASEESHQTAPPHSLSKYPASDIPLEQ